MAVAAEVAAWPVLLGGTSIDGSTSFRDKNVHHINQHEMFRRFISSEHQEANLSTRPIAILHISWICHTVTTHAHTARTSVVPYTEIETKWSSSSTLTSHCTSAAHLFSSSQYRTSFDPCTPCACTCTSSTSRQHARRRLQPLIRTRFPRLDLDVRALHARITRTSR